MDLSRKIDIYSLRQRWNKLAASEKFREFASVAFILALAATMLSPVLRGDWPIGHDHPVHLFRIWQLREQLLHHVSPWGWSHRWFAGYPQNVIYPIGADLFVLIVQALSFGLLKLGNAYGVAFLLFYFLYGYATYFFVRRAVGSRIAALIAVIFLLTDPGSNEIGGWFWIVDLGVWTAALGMVPALIATALIAALMEKPNPKTAAGIALCIGLALVCHLIVLIYFAIAIPLLCLSRFISAEKTNWSQFFLMLEIAGAIGVLIASFWLVPYIAALPYAGEIGTEGLALKKMGNDFLSGHLFDRMHAIPTAFGCIGALCLLRARRTLPLFMSLFIFVTIVVASAGFASLFGTNVAEWLQKHIIAPRMLMLLKPFWYGAVGFFVVAAWRAVAQFRVPADEQKDAIGPKWMRRTVIIVLIATFVGPILIYSAATFWRWEIRRPTIWQSQRHDLEARQDFVTWMKSELDRQGGFFRIAHGFDANDHDFADLAIEVPYPFYEIDHTPTGHFKYEVWSSFPAALHYVNVRFALSHRPLARGDFRLVKVFRNQIWLYELHDWNQTPFEVRGSGPVELLEFGQEEIVLRAGEGATGTLHLNVAYYPNWRAKRDQSALPITLGKVPVITRAMFMEVPLSPGTYRFYYRHGPSDYVGTILCVLGVIACVSLAKSRRVAAWLDCTAPTEQLSATN